MIALPRDYLGAREVAELLDVDLDTVYAFVRRGVSTPYGRIFLDALRVGHCYRFTEDQVKAFIDRQNPVRDRADAAKDEAGRRAAGEARDWWKKRTEGKKGKKQGAPPG